MIGRGSQKGEVPGASFLSYAGYGQWEWRFDTDTLYFDENLAVLTGYANREQKPAEKARRGLVFSDDYENTQKTLRCAYKINKLFLNTKCGW